MVYLYDCPNCHEVYEPVQSSEGEHQEYPCKCGQMAKRVYTTATVPSMKLNSGFYSTELGRDVKDHKEFEALKEEQRFKHGLNVHLGNNATPKQKWVDEAAAQDAVITQEARRHDEKTSEDYREHYDKVTTFTDTNRE